MGGMRQLLILTVILSLGVLPSCLLPDLGYLYSVGSSRAEINVSDHDEEASLSIDIESRAEVVKATVKVNATSGSIDWVLQHDGVDYWSGTRDQGNGELAFEVPASEGRWTLKWKTVAFAGDIRVRISAQGH